MLHCLQDRQNKGMENKYKLLNSPVKQVRFGTFFILYFLPLDL